MDCPNHPGIPATGQCAHCGKELCQNCLVTIDGNQYCADCQADAVQPSIPATQPPAAPPPSAVPPPIVQAPFVQPQMMMKQPCKEADTALILAIVGFLCCVILQPFAIVQALKAKKMIEANPALEGAGKAQAALILAIVGLCLWALGIIFYVIALALFLTSHGTMMPH